MINAYRKQQSESEISSSSSNSASTNKYASTNDSVPQNQLVSMIKDRISQVNKLSSLSQASKKSFSNSISQLEQQVREKFENLIESIRLKESEMLKTLHSIQTTETEVREAEIVACSEQIKHLQQLLSTNDHIENIDIQSWQEDQRMWNSKLSQVESTGLEAKLQIDLPSTLENHLNLDNIKISYQSSPDVSEILKIRPKINSDKNNRMISKTRDGHSSSHSQKTTSMIMQSSSGFLRKWNIDTSSMICEINHPGLRSWATFEAGTKVVVASAKIKIYDLANGNCLTTLDDISSPVKRILAGGNDMKARAISFHVNQGLVALWDLYQGIKLNCELDISNWNIALIVPLLPESNLILVPTYSFPFDVIIFNMITGDVEEKRLEGFPNEVLAVEPFGAGNYAFVLCAGGLLSLFSLKESKEIKSVQLDPKYNKISIYVASSSEITWPIVACHGPFSGYFSVYNPNTDETTSITHLKSSVITSSIRSVNVYANGKRAISAHANGKAFIWDLASSECLETVPLSINGGFILCNGEMTLIAGTMTGSLVKIDANSNQTEMTQPSADTSSIQVHLMDPPSSHIK